METPRGSPPFWRANAGLLAGAAVCQAAYTALALRGDLGTHIPLTWAAFYTAFAAYAAVSWRAVRRPSGSLGVVLAGALVFRLTLLPSTPSLSDDIYRYLWDGRVQWAGVNPYRYAPEAAELAPLQVELGEVFPQINHRHIPTIYPPVAQVFFLAVTGGGANPVAAKVGLVLAEALLVAAVLGLLRQRGLDSRRLVLYAWNPLAVVEIAGSGHVDALALALLCGALYWLGRGAWRRSGAVLGAAFLAKLVPAVAAPLLWREHRRALRRASAGAGLRLDMRALPPLGWFVAVAALGYGAYASAGAGLFHGLWTYAATWRFNSAAYSLLASALQIAGLTEAAALQAARWVCAVAFAGIAAGLYRRCADPARATFLLLGAHLALSPTVHPWYVLWILPFLPLFPELAWVALSGLVFLAYWVLDGYRSGGVWKESTWVRCVEYAPFYALLTRAWLARAWLAVTRRRRSQPPA